MTAMDVQTWIVLLLTALSVGFLFWGFFFRSSSSSKGCASGCGACPSSTCALRKREAQLKAESKTTR